MKYGLIGEKLSHSFSPEIHKSLSGLNYQIKELKENELSSFFLKKDFLGLNVTIPYKESVIKYLDSLSEEAGKIGAVNTVINQNGKLLGFNTDALGLMSLIKENDISLKGKSVLILGSGGTSKTAAYVAEKMSAKEILRVSRTKKDGFITYGDVSFTEEIIINTTPCGMFPEIKDLPLDLKKFKNLEAFIDAVYNPLCTPAVLLAKQMGAKATGGLYMLIKQAEESQKLFGIKNIRPAFSVCNEILNQKQNLVLIGMPGSGKTALAKIIAEKLNREFIDTDSLTEEQTGSINDYILSCGEEKFRQKESEIINGLKFKTGAVIATGGGAVLRAENVNNLKLNGTFCYVKRDLKNLATNARPLSKDLENLFAKRKPLYEKYADFEAENNTALSSAAEKIIKEFLK